MIITANQVARAYLGRPGCMCGCNGTYVESGSGLTRRINRMNALIAEGKAVIDHDFIYYTDEKTNLVVYLKAGEE